MWFPCQRPTSSLGAHPPGQTDGQTDHLWLRPTVQDWPGWAKQTKLAIPAVSHSCGDRE